jgi:hypothetical protein
LFTKVTWLPRGTVVDFGLTALFAIVIVDVVVPPPLGGGFGDGAGGAPLLVEPPPHAATRNATPMANPPAAFLHLLIMPAGSAKAVPRHETFESHESGGFRATAAVRLTDLVRAYGL